MKDKNVCRIGLGYVGFSKVIKNKSVKRGDEQMRRAKSERRKAYDQMDFLRILCLT